jgi:hypothetical protein
MHVPHRSLQLSEGRRGMAGVPLASAIRRLRAELLESMQEAEGEQLRFALGDIELDLQLEVSQEGKGDAGIRFWAGLARRLGQRLAFDYAHRAPEAHARDEGGRDATGLSIATADGPRADPLMSCG